MGEEETSRRAAAICESCETVHSVRIGPDGGVRPIGTGQGAECTCGDTDFRVISEDRELLSDVESKERTQTD